MSDAELRSRVLMLLSSIKKLQQLATYSKQEFLADFKISDAVLRNLQISIEALIDIGNYILKRIGREIPMTRAEVFERLCEAGILDSSRQNHLVQIARFRNLLVHGHVAINLERVYQILQEEIGFIETVANQLVAAAERI